MLLTDSGRIEVLWVASGKASSRVKEILELAGKKGVAVQFRGGTDLDNMVPGVAHQGFVARTAGFRYTELSDILDRASGRPGSGLIVAADHITDEGNLGALIRTAAFFGVQGLLLPRDRSARITGRVLKGATGTSLHLPVARVVNLVRTLDQLKESGFWIIGAAGEAAESIYRFDWIRDTVLVMGREDRGLSAGVRGCCHELVSIPGSGGAESLNVSVAAGIILSEIFRQSGAS